MLAFTSEPHHERRQGLWNLFLSDWLEIGRFLCTHFEDSFVDGGELFDDFEEDAGWIIFHLACMIGDEDVGHSMRYEIK